jgi:hypothetical protein
MAAGSLEGHWVLVEQNYGHGKANFAPQDKPVHIEFTMEGAELTGRIWSGEGRVKGVRWPAFDAGDGLLPLHLERYRIDPQSGMVRAEYEVRLSNMTGLVLRVTEDYSLSDAGDALVGMVTVSFERDGKPGGSYVLHRRFERTP